MKIVSSDGYVFNPDASPPTIDFSGSPGVTLGTLLAAVNASHPGPLYAAGKPGLGGHWTGARVALQASAAGMLSTDTLFVFVDDGAAGARDATVSDGLQRLHDDAVTLLQAVELLATEKDVQAVADKAEQMRVLLAQLLAASADAVWWEEASAQPISALFASPSRSSGTTPGVPGPYRKFVAIVKSTVSGMISIVNEDVPALSLIVKHPANVLREYSPSVFGSKFHVEFAPDTPGSFSLTSAFTK